MLCRAAARENEKCHQPKLPHQVSIQTSCADVVYHVRVADPVHAGSVDDSLAGADEVFAGIGVDSNPEAPPEATPEADDGEPGGAFRAVNAAPKSVRA